MIDYVKILVTGLSPSDWTNNPQLKFKTIVDRNTGEIKSELAELGGLQFVIKNNRLTMQGSIHKYFNHLMGVSAPNQSSYKTDKGFNGNRFNYKELTFVLDNLQQTFGIDPNWSKLQNVETGVNIEMYYTTNKILSGLVLIKGKQFNRPKASTYRQAVLSQLYVKAYDKASQYGMPMEVFRYEIKYRKMSILNKAGIVFLSDLLNVSKLNRCLDLMLYRFDQILMIDPTIDELNLTQNERMRLKQYQSIEWWLDLRANHRDRHKKRYYEIEAKQSKYLKTDLRRLIIEEWNKCMTCVIDNHSSIGSTITHLYTYNRYKQNRILNTHY